MRLQLYGALAFSIAVTDATEAQAGTMCCVTPKRVWKTTDAQCKAAGGGPTNISYCREVCCVAGQRVWTTGDAQCRKECGGPTNASYCRRVCCVGYNGSFVGRIRLSTQVDCYRGGGQSLSCAQQLCCEYDARRSGLHKVRTFMSAQQCSRRGRRVADHLCRVRVRPLPR